MRSRLLGLLFFSLSSALFGQNQTLVFDSEGKIIKNHPYERSQKNDFEMRFLIEKPKDPGAYYLAWQWRNEYNFQANVVYRNDLNVVKFNEGKINDTVFNKLDEDQKFFSYLLIKTNSNGETYLDSLIKEKKKLSIDELLKTTKIENYWSFLDGDEKLKLMGAFDLKSEAESSLKLKNKILDSLDKNFSLEIEELKSQIQNKKLAIDKISLVDEAPQSPQIIKALSVELDSLILLLLPKQSQKEKDLKVLNDEIKEIEKKITRINDGLKSKFSEINTKHASSYTFLNNGVIISKIPKTSEIVYDAHYNKLFKSEIENLKIARLTPNLPQLHTDSELYCHVINLKRENLETNPFVISMTSEQSEPVEIESPSNLKDLESLVTSFDDDIFKNIGFAPEIEEGLDGNLKDNAILDHINSYFKKDVDERVKSDFYQPYFTILLSFVQLENLDKEIEDSFKNRIKSLNKNFDDNKTIILLLDLKVLVKKISFKEFTPITILKSEYTEFLVKYPRPFEANRKPTIKLLSNQFTTENYLQKVSEGELKKESYDIKFDNIELVSDELPPVHRLFRFSINAGALITSNVSYSYEQVPIANSTTNDLIEKKERSLDIRPSITFSTYIHKQDVAINQPIDQILKTTHFDISVDYADSKILDNLYLGLGFEPIRNLHIAGGFRIGEVERIDNDNYDPFKPIAEQDLSSEINLGGYFSVSLGFNLVPKFINLIVKK